MIFSRLVLHLSIVTTTEDGGRAAMTRLTHCFLQRATLPTPPGPACAVAHGETGAAAAGEERVPTWVCFRCKEEWRTALRWWRSRAIRTTTSGHQWWRWSSRSRYFRRRISNSFCSVFCLWIPHIITEWLLRFLPRFGKLCFPTGGLNDRVFCNLCFLVDLLIVRIELWVTTLTGLVALFFRTLKDISSSNLTIQSIPKENYIDGLLSL